MENLINSRERDFAVGSSLSILESTKETLDKAGIEKMVYEDFYEDFETLVQSITKPSKDGRTLNIEQLLFAFQQPEGELLVHITIILLIWFPQYRIRSLYIFVSWRCVAMAYSFSYSKNHLSPLKFVSTEIRTRDSWYILTQRSPWMLIHFVQMLFKPWGRKLVRCLSFYAQ